MNGWCAIVRAFGRIEVELPRFDPHADFAPGAQVYVTPKRVQVFGDPDEASDAQRPTRIGEPQHPEQTQRT